MTFWKRQNYGDIKLICWFPGVRVGRRDKQGKTQKILGLLKWWLYIIVQFSSVAQSCPTLCNPMNGSTAGFPVHHQLPELAQTHVYDAIQSSHPLSPPSSPALNLSQHQGLFQWLGSSHQVAKLLEFQLQHQSFQWMLSTDFLYGWLVWSPCSPRSGPSLKHTISSMK